MKKICLNAGLGRAEIALVESYINDDDGHFLETSAYEKLYEYFATETCEMPYDVVKARTETPDDWILDQLASCKITTTII
jgi:hypothetical protein